MKKHLLYLLLIVIGIAGCKKQHTVPPPPEKINGLRGKYVMYMNIDTFYNYTSPSQFTLDVTHETLTGDTVYISSGTPGQVIRPNPIAGYDPKIALADTLVFVNDYSGTRYVPGGGIDFKYNFPLRSYVEFPIPGVTVHILPVGSNAVEITTDTVDPDGGLSDSNGQYYKKL